MLAPCTSWHAMHRELSGKAGQLDTRDRGRLTTIARKPGPPTAKDIRWLETKYTEANMARKIDEESERLIFEARKHLLNCQTREEAIAVDHKEAKNATATAQYRLNKLVDECENPALFTKAE